MSKLVTRQIESALKALSALTQKDSEKSYVLPAATRIRAAGNIRRLRDLLDKIGAEQTELFTKYGKPVDGKPGEFTVEKTSELWSEFETAFNDLNKAEFEVQLDSITEAELMNPRVVKIRDDKGKVYENAEENQIPIDLIIALQDSNVLANPTPPKAETP